MISEPRCFIHNEEGNGYAYLKEHKFDKDGFCNRCGYKMTNKTEIWWCVKNDKIGLMPPTTRRDRELTILHFTMLRDMTVKDMEDAGYKVVQVKVEEV